MNELTEALELLDYSAGRLQSYCDEPNCSGCAEHAAKRKRASELITLLSTLPAIIATVRDKQMACLRALTRHDWLEARECAVNAEIELERLEEGFLTERLQVPGAPPATLRTMEFDGLTCWTLRSELTGELLTSGHIAAQPEGAPRTAQQVAVSACYHKLRTIAQCNA